MLPAQLQRLAVHTQCNAFEGCIHAAVVDFVQILLIIVARPGRIIHRERAFVVNRRYFGFLIIEVRFQQRQPIRIGRPLVKQVGIAPSVYVIGFAPRRSGQVIRLFDRVIMPLLAVERCADTVVVIDLISNLTQEAVVFVLGRIRNTACRTTDIRSAAGTLYRITTLARAFSLVTATLRIKQSSIHAIVAQAEAECICPFAVAAAVTVFHHHAELPLRQQQITPLQGLVIHAATQCTAAGIERVRPFHDVDVAHQFRVNRQARAVEVAITGIQRVFFGIRQVYAVNADADTVAFHAAYGKAFLMAATVAQANVGGITYQVFVVAYHFLLDTAKVDTFHGCRRIALTFNADFFYLCFNGCGFSCSFIRCQDWIAENTADQRGNGEHL